MRICNAYCGIGGNRRLWGEEHSITAIEHDPKIATIYKEFFPKDTVIVGDAHQYLLDHYKEFDFIWSSPPCPSHSDIRRCGVHKGQCLAIYPDMKLYEEVILLKNFAPKNVKWVVENVKPYYKLLIHATEVDRHLFWSNFHIGEKQGKDKRRHNDIVGSKEVYGFNISDKDINDKRKVLRNCVNPHLGLHVLEESKRDLHQDLF